MALEQFWRGTLAPEEESDVTGQFSPTNHRAEAKMAESEISVR